MPLCPSNYRIYKQFLLSSQTLQVSNFLHCWSGGLLSAVPVVFRPKNLLIRCSVALASTASRPFESDCAEFCNYATGIKTFFSLQNSPLARQGRFGNSLPNQQLL